MASPEARARQQVFAYQDLNAELTSLAEALGIDPPNVMEKHKDPLHKHTVRARNLTEFLRVLNGAVVSVQQDEDGGTVVIFLFDKPEPEAEEEPEGEQEEQSPEEGEAAEDAPEGDEEPVEVEPEGESPNPSDPHGVLVDAPATPEAGGATIEEIVVSKVLAEDDAAQKRSEAAKKEAATRAANKAKKEASGN